MTATKTRARKPRRRRTTGRRRLVAGGRWVATKTRRYRTEVHCGYCGVEGGHWVRRSEWDAHYEGVRQRYENSREAAKAAKQGRPAKTSAPLPSQSRATSPSPTPSTATKGTAMTSPQPGGATNGSAPPSSNGSAAPAGGGRGGGGGAPGGPRSSGSAKIANALDAMSALSTHRPETLYDEIAYGGELSQLAAALADSLRRYANNRVSEGRIPPNCAERLHAAAQVVSSAGEHVLDYGRALWSRFGAIAEELARRDTPGAKYFEGATR
jgi:hypothetical protein